MLSRDKGDPECNGLFTKVENPAVHDTLMAIPESLTCITVFSIIIDNAWPRTAQTVRIMGF